jgi:ribosome-binding factor A
VGITTPSSSSSTTSGRDYDGTENSSNGGINEELRRRINIVHANVSPDLRQARVTISVLSTAATTAVAHEPSSSSAAAGVTSTLEQQRIRKANDAIARRRAYAWLVSNTKSIRHALSKRMSHMKGGAPELTFVQVDVGGAVDVMNLIDKVSNRNYKREMDGLSFDDMLRMGYDEDDYDEDDDGWVDDDDEEEDDEDYDDDDDNEDYDDNVGDNTITMSKGKEGVIVEEDMVEQMGVDEEMDDDDWVDFDDVDEDEEEEEEK